MAIPIPLRLRRLSVTTLGVLALYEAITGPTLQWLTGWFVYPALIFCGACVLSKRLHDRGRSGWWAALILFAVAIVFIAVLTKRQEQRFAEADERGAVLQEDDAVGAGERGRAVADDHHRRKASLGSEDVVGHCGTPFVAAAPSLFLFAAAPDGPFVQVPGNALSVADGVESGGEVDLEAGQLCGDPRRVRARRCDARHHLPGPRDRAPDVDLAQLLPRVRADQEHRPTEVDRQGEGQAGRRAAGRA